MAIQDSFNISNALNSQSYAYKCWYNYNYGNNTMGISAKDMGQITQAWNSQLANWRAVALDDENAYEIEDDDFSRAKKSGRNNAEEKSGHDGSKGGMIANGVVDAGLSVGAAIGGKAVGNVAAKALNKVGACVLQGGAVEVGKNGAKKTVKLSDIATVVMASVVAAKYWIQKPNKDQKEACDALQDEMTNAQAALDSAQVDMQDAGEEVITRAVEAQTLNEETNKEIEDNKSEYDTYKASYDALMAKVKAGETLTEDEKDLLIELAPIMQELGEEIGDVQKDATEQTGDIYDEMTTIQEDYDNSAETIAEVEGLTDFAESFDSTTQVMCYVEAGAQTLNATSASIAAAKLAGKAFVGWAFAAVGFAAAASSGVAAGQQFSWAGEVGTEIGLRKGTQDLNSLTTDIYDESIADYEGNMSVVEDLEIEMPKDMENLDETIAGMNEEISAATGGGAESSNGAKQGTNTFGILQSGNNSSDFSSGANNKDDKEKEV